MIYLIKEIVGQNCITREAGDKVYNIVYPILKSGGKAELDFEGIKVFASPFFNAAIGHLLKDFNQEDLTRQLFIHKLAPVGADVLKLVITNSSQYYSDENFRQNLDDILNEQED